MVRHKRAFRDHGIHMHFDNYTLCVCISTVLFLARIKFVYATRALYGVLVRKARFACGYAPEQQREDRSILGVCVIRVLLFLVRSLGVAPRPRRPPHFSNAPALDAGRCLPESVRRHEDFRL